MEYPKAENSVFAVIDMQEKLLNAIASSGAILPRVQVLVKGAAALGIPLVATEQYPKGLGTTVPSVKELLGPGVAIVEKTSFSCWAEQGFRDAVGMKRTLVLSGVETHVCVLQTALDAAYAGHEVFVVSDAVASRKDSDRAAGLDFLKENGIRVVSSEMLLFMYLRNSGHPVFKEISKIIR